MPEGDTIHRAAARLRPALEGAAVERWEAPRLRGERPRIGSVIERVEARGKNLLVDFDDGTTLRTHLRMSGSWHLYRTGERWQKPAHLARVRLEVDTGWVAVCFSAPVVETYRRGRAEPAALAGLGPDLCVPGGDGGDALDEVVRRLGQVVPPATGIGEALLDQRVAAGIGNVYKSEACFAAELDPWTPVGELGPDDLRRVWGIAARQLQSNLGRAERRTHPRGLAVYGRRGQPCHRCGATVQMARQGEQARSTYWCPGCQRRPAERS